MSEVIDKLLQVRLEDRERFFHEWARCMNDEIAFAVSKRLAANAHHALLDMASLKNTEFCAICSHGALGALNVLAMAHREQPEDWHRTTTFIGLLCLSQDVNVASSAIRQFQYKFSNAMNVGHSYLIQACNSIETSFFVRYKGMSVRGLAFLVLIISEYPIDDVYVSADAIGDCYFGLNAWLCEGAASDSRFSEWCQLLDKVIERRSRVSPKMSSVSNNL